MPFCEYDPFITSGGTLTPPDLTGPTIDYVTDQNIQLTFPFVSPTLTVVLKRPSFNDIRAVKRRRIVNRARGLELNILREQDWPRFTIIRYSFDNLSQDMADDLETFLATSTAKEIGLRDYEGRNWKGIITNPDASFTQTNNCYFATTLDFEVQPA